MITKGNLALAATLFAASAQASEECAQLSNDTERLACYDSEYRPTVASTQSSEWLVNEEASPIDDSRSVYLSVSSTDEIRNRYGRPGHARLVVRCVENTTSMILTFANHHMTSHRQYGTVTLRIDDETAFERRMSESTDNKALGLWNGGSSIPVIRSMYGNDVLTVRATPYSESPITAQFPITGLEEAITPLREACHW